MSCVALQHLLQDKTTQSITTGKPRLRRKKKTNAQTKQEQHLERGFNNRPYHPTPQMHQRRPISMLRQPDPEASIADLLQKYRRFAVGFPQGHSTKQDSPPCQYIP